MITRRRFLTIAAASAAYPAAAHQAEWRGRALGADVTLLLAGGADPSARVWRRITRELAAIEAHFSLFAESELARLNATGRLAWPSAQMQAMVRLSDEVNKATKGAFDPTIQPLWQAIAHGADPAAARALVGWDKLRHSEHEIALLPGMALTFNGIAQGAAADRLAEVMRDEGFTDILIDASEIQALGHAGNRDWQVGIAGPDGTLLRRLSLGNRALATSSPFGTRIGAGLPHIQRAAGGAPHWSTVSVSATSGALADALSTAICLMKREDIDSALAHFPDAKLEYLA